MLVHQLHDFVRDVQLQTDEWEAAWQFLTKVLSFSASAEYSCLAEGYLFKRTHYYPLLIDYT
jgi:hypothetical protein